MASGSMMGSGGMVVVDDTTCMVDFAKFFLSSPPRRAAASACPVVWAPHACSRSWSASPRAWAPWRTSSGSRSCATTSSEGSLCQLGGSAPTRCSPRCATSGTRSMAHVEQKCCPAKVCRPLIQYRIDAEACTGCHVCFAACPTDAISGDKKQLHVIDQKLCIQCDTCRQVCKFDAVDVETGIFALAAKGGSSEPAHQDRRRAYHRRPQASTPKRARPCSPWRVARASTSPRCATRRASPPGAPAASAWSRSRARQAAGGLHHLGRGRHGRAHRHASACAPEARELPQDVPLGPQQLL